LKANRLCTIVKDCIWEKTGETLTFLLTKDPELSTISGYQNGDEHSAARVHAQEISVNTITLYDLLEREQAPKFINYISVDTEGTEPLILKKFFEENNNKYTVKCWTVEHNFLEANRQQVFEMMVANGYKRVHQNISRWDDFYIKKGLE